MDPIPPEPVVPLSPVASAAYTDVPVDPASVPVDQPIDPAPVALADEEVESDPEEDLHMGPVSSDDADEVDPTDEESPDHPTSDSDSEDYAAQRERARLFSTAYVSTSRAPRPLPRYDPYFPHPAPIPSPTPSFVMETPLSTPNQVVPYEPRPPPAALLETTDPAMASLRDDAFAVGGRVSQFGRNLTVIPGSSNFNNLEEHDMNVDRQLDHVYGQVSASDRSMENMDARISALERRLFRQIHDLRIRGRRDREEIRELRSQLQQMKDQLSRLNR